MQIRSLRIVSYRSWKIDERGSSEEANNRREKLELYWRLRAEGCSFTTAFCSQTPIKLKFLTPIIRFFTTSPFVYFPTAIRYYSQTSDLHLKPPLVNCQLNFGGLFYLNFVSHLSELRQ